MLTFVALAVLQVPAAQATDPRIYEAIRKSAFEHSEVMQNLEHLCDRIGPRLTGTPRMERASEWTRQRFADYGLAAELEGFEIARGWHRVRATARVVEPIERDLELAAGGWTPSTNGTVRAQVVDLGAPRAPGAPREPAEGSRIDGRIVLTAPIPWSRRAEGNPFEGAVALFQDSQKPHTLLNMTSMNWGPPHTVGTIPGAFLSSEDFQLLSRLCASGDEVVVELDIRNAVTEGPVTVHNTVAELAGVGARKDEIVFAGAHLDSWDLASGTTDNGVGSMVVLEAARILAGLDQRPNRTIRFLLFTGEEQGLVGSRRYVEAHADEMDRHAGGLVMDIGTGDLLGLSLHNQTQLFDIVEKWFEPVRDLGFKDSSFRRQGGTDHLSFQQRGVPAFAFIQEPVEYFLTHHTQSDTFDKAVEDNLKQAACVLATGLWAMAWHDGDIPRFDAKRARDGGEQPRLGRGERR